MALAGVLRQLRLDVDGDRAVAAMT
jgi:hypothetical protein